ncbi:MAG: ABC transporter permease, partial [Pseudomonadota bacterium]|nr:ABC transporter permease [Pseudomonadota bacterium]
VFMAFLLIILAFAIVSIFGVGTDKVILAITICFIPRYARVVRLHALAIQEIPIRMSPVLRVFASPDHSLAHGAKMAPFLIMLTAFVGQAILTEASLSFPWYGHAAKT